MRKYESPMAEVVAFEVANVIAASGLVPEVPADTPDVLTTWGNRIGEVDSANANIFD